MKKLLCALSLFVVSHYVNSQCDYTIEMQDSWGDGWNGATFTMTDGVNTITSGGVTEYTDFASEFLCVPAGCYEVTVGGGATDYEISFTLGDLIVEAQAGIFTDISIGEMDGVAYCDIILGCTDSLAANYNPIATTDDGSCVYCQFSTIDSISVSSACPGDTIIIYGDSLCAPMRVHLQGWTIPDSMVIVSTSSYVEWIVPLISSPVSGVNLRYINNGTSYYTNILQNLILEMTLQLLSLVFLLLQYFLIDHVFPQKYLSMFEFVRQNFHKDRLDLHFHSKK